ncbi:MAG: AMP phosphorylase [Candidatus Woesearchaeota archaeon]|nr:AMP phosphorylase [Candidatus Woesearchaeota archaeon]
MKLKVKDMDVATGEVLVAVMNEHDAALFDLHLADRVKLKRGNKEVITVVDFAESENIVPKGSIGLFEEVLDKLSTKDGDIVNMSVTNKPISLTYIKNKMDGKELKYEEVREIINDTVSNMITMVELTYYVAANYMRGMSFRETVALTRAMIDAGKKIKLDAKIVVDKHCIGGVAGNRTTMISVPILTAAGLAMPKTSSRSITSPAGTADTMEIIANVNLSMKEILSTIKKTGGCMVWGGAVDLAPADDTIINIEHPLSIDAEGQLLASIMAKKGSVSATHLLVDIPVGKDAKIESMKEAKHLGRQFEKLGKAIGIKTKVIITDGSQPIGNGIGPALEARDVMWLLKGDKRAPQDLREKSIYVSGLLLEMCGKAKKGRGMQMAEDIIGSCKAYHQFMAIARAQGLKIKDEKDIYIGEHTYNYIAEKSGTVRHISNKDISKVARIAGCPKDKGAGIYLYRHKGDRVEKGDKLFTIYADTKEKLKFAKQTLLEIDGVEIR